VFSPKLCCVIAGCTYPDRVDPVALEEPAQETQEYEDEEEEEEVVFWHCQRSYFISYHKGFKVLQEAYQTHATSRCDDVVRY